MLLTFSVMAKIPAREAPAMKMAGSCDPLKKLIAVAVVAGSRAVIPPWRGVDATLDDVGLWKLKFLTHPGTEVGEKMARSWNVFLLFRTGPTNAIASVVAVLDDAAAIPMIAGKIPK